MDFRKKYDGEVGRHEQGGCLHQDGRGQVGLGGGDRRIPSYFYANIFTSELNINPVH